MWSARSTAAPDMPWDLRARRAPRRAVPLLGLATPIGAALVSSVMLVAAVTPACEERLLHHRRRVRVQPRARCLRFEPGVHGPGYGVVRCAARLLALWRVLGNGGAGAGRVGRRHPAVATPARWGQADGGRGGGKHGWFTRIGQAFRRSSGHDHEMPWNDTEERIRAHLRRAAADGISCAYPSLFKF